jgi:glycosyltransferase involved in cell wall biosynthesis
VFVTADKFPPFRADLAVLFGKELKGRGHHIDWLLQSEAPCRQSYRTRWKGGRAWVAANPQGSGLWRRIARNLCAFMNDWRLAALLRKREYDFVQVKDKYVTALLALALARVFKTGFVFWLSYPFHVAMVEQADEGTAQFPWIYRVCGYTFSLLLHHIIAPAADFVVVQSEPMKHDLVKRGIPAAKIRAVPMGVDTKLVREVLALPLAEKPSEEKWLVYLGVLDRYRRVDFLVRVLAKVLEHEPRAILIFVGWADDFAGEQAIMAQARALGIEEKVRITGKMSMPDAWKWVRLADVCISPYYPSPVLLATSPTKLVEYMALGRPVVATEHPEQRQLLDHSGAGICVEYDEVSVADAVSKVLDDSRLGDAMGERGRRHIPSHRGYDVIAADLDRTYRELLCRLKNS